MPLCAVQLEPLDTGPRLSQITHQRMDSPGHWSKDFVEHLRTVHLGLIAVSLGLIVITFSAKPYNAAIALREIHQIMELRKLWSIGWLMTRASQKQINIADQDTARIWTTPGAASGLETLGKTDERGASTGPREIALTTTAGSNVSGLEAVINAKKRGNTNARKNYVRHFYFNSQYWLQEPAGAAWSPSSFPTTLQEFKDWWTALTTSRFRAAFPESVDPGGQCSRDEETVLILGVSNDSNHSQGVRLVPEVRNGAITYRGDWDFPVGICEFAVRKFAYVEVSQQTLVDVFKNWQPGSFNKSFSDLALATKELQSLELDDIEKFVASEAATVGSEVFEAFGMKIPLRQISVWGSVLLLGVQLYFFVYLKQLSGKLRSTDPGWDVPWIGMDTSWLGQAIFFVTITMLPWCTVLLLKVRSGFAVSAEPNV